MDIRYSKEFQKHLPWNRYRYNLREGLGENGKFLSGGEEHAEIACNIASEGMVLLKNNGVLPLKKGSTVALFGIGSVDYIAGGTGSGAVYPYHVYNLYDGLALYPDDIKLYDEPSEYYTNYCLTHTPSQLNGPALTIFPEIELPQSIVDNAAKAADTAIIVLHRISGEAYDRLPDIDDIPQSFYLDENEQKLINQIKAKFDKIAVMLNTAGIMETDFIRSDEKIGAGLLAWLGGGEGGKAMAQLLLGKVNPSGKLTDTLARSLEDYPSTKAFTESEYYTDYAEDIYVGYRYFETIPNAKERVVYPFGYGLSYTQFEYSDIEAAENDGKIELSFTVKNIGGCAGKEVAECYYSAPDGVLGKPSVELCGFHKTRLLQSGESEDITISFAINDMASYDDLGKLQKSAWLLEKGTYKFFVGPNCRDLIKAKFELKLKENIITEQLTSQLYPVALEKRMLSNGELEPLPKASLPTAPEELSSYKANHSPIINLDKHYSLEDVFYGKTTLRRFMDTIGEKDLIHLLGGHDSTGLGNVRGVGDLQARGIARIMLADGPAGVRIEPETGVGTTHFPCATLLACTWNPTLSYEMGKAGAIECKENAFAMWLTPALNIHRNPLCGRNFEYYSEDPLISGIFAAAQVNGIQGQKIAACAKHFAFNNKEDNRYYSDSRVSERAAREIYLKGFRIMLNLSDPWAFMTSYNVVNGRRTCESFELVKNILRGEWGYDNLVTTDWSVPCNQSLVLKATNDIRMPFGYEDNLIKDFYAGIIKRNHIEEGARHLLEFILKVGE